METTIKTKKDLILMILFGISFAGILFLALEEAFNPAWDWNIGWFHKKTISEEIVKPIQVNYTPEQFVIVAAKKADSLKITGPTKIRLKENESILGSSAKYATVAPFPKIQDFSEIAPYYKKYILDIVYISPDTKSNLPPAGYKINYTSFIRDFRPGEKFQVKSTVKYAVNIGKDNYLTNQNGREWGRRYK